MIRRPPDLASLRAALWTYRALRRANRHVQEEGFENLSLPNLPELPASAIRGVQAALRRWPHTCLERSLVLQRWHAAHGRRLDVVVGVSGTGDAFRAHAWLENEAHSPDGGPFVELRRVHP